jgi:uncharacterized membrane protein YjjB (DUF3815 family)
MKLAKDFGVRALFGTLIIIGVFGLCFYLAVNDKLPAEILAGVVGTLGTLVGFYFGTEKKAS